MKKIGITTFAFLCTLTTSFGFIAPVSAKTDTDKIMSAKYWNNWNTETQSKIDANIEANRKADAIVKINAKDGTEIRVEQETHEFIFGAHIFNFNQLGSKELNDKYKALYGTFFNSATIPFYWKTFEPKPGKPRFETAHEDTEEFWNKCENPYQQPHWRRPSTDQLVDFCEAKKIRIHGHPLVWGIRSWHHPEWLFEELASPEEKKALEPYIDALSNNKNSKYDAETLKKYKAMNHEDLAKLIPNYTDTLNKTMEKRISEIATRYGSRIQSWDVCNESAADFDKDRIKDGSKITQSRYGLMPGDYTFQAFKLAEKYLPKNAKLNINDYYIKEGYINQIKSLQARGSKIDIAGYQMHIFKPQAAKNIAEGANAHTPEKLLANLALMDKVNLPIHMSEITVPAPGTTELDEKIQAIIAANFYRLWFSHKNVMGITWWNVVDGCGVAGEPTTSGLFTRDMKAKPAFYALDNLINKEWKTNTSVKIENGEVKFRGFKGKYKLSWTNANGKTESVEYYLK